MTALVAEAQHVDTEQGVRAYERLVAILTRPAIRIARAKLEGLLSRGEASDDDINEVVYDAHYKLYKMLHRYIPGTPVMPWFATIVRRKATDFARRQNHTRARNRSEMTSYDDLALAVAAHEKDLYAWLTIEEIAEGLAPDDQQVLSLLHSGHSTAEIAVLLGRTGPWVRSRRKALREAFCPAR